MNKRRIFLTSILASGLAVGTAAWAGPGGKHCAKHGKDGDRTEMMQKKMDRMATKLGLSDTQQQQVKELMEGYKGAVKPLHEQKRALRKQMQALDPTSETYEQELTTAANQQADLIRQLTIAKGQKRQAMARILTAEQREKMQQFRAERKERYKNKRHGGGE